MTMIDTPEGIEAFRLLSCYGRLKLEMKGMRFSLATFPALKRQFPEIATRDNREFFRNFERMLWARGILNLDYCYLCEEYISHLDERGEMSADGLEAQIVHAQCGIEAGCEIA